MKITIEVPDVLLRNALDSAGPAIARWCKSWDRTPLRVTLMCHETPETEYTFTWSDVATAVQTMAELPSLAKHLGDLLSGRGDSVTADVLVQCAAFGVPRYG